MKSWSNSEIPNASGHVPEKRLLAAVLQRAISDFIGSEGELRDGALAWIMEDEASDAPLTFKFICEALDLDPASLRSAILSSAEREQRFAEEVAV